MDNFEPEGDAISFNSWQIKETLRAMFRRYRIADRAYLSMARYNRLERPVPVLCVKFRRGVPTPLFEAFMEEAAAALKEMIGGFAFDLISLDEERERKLSAVSSPFFDLRDVVAKGRSH